MLFFFDSIRANGERGLGLGRIPSPLNDDVRAATHERRRVPGLLGGSLPTASPPLRSAELPLDDAPLLVRRRALAAASASSWLRTADPSLPTSLCSPCLCVLIGLGSLPDSTFSMMASAAWQSESRANAAVVEANAVVVEAKAAVAASVAEGRAAEAAADLAEHQRRRRQRRRRHGEHAADRAEAQRDDRRALRLPPELGERVVAGEVEVQRAHDQLQREAGRGGGG